MVLRREEVVVERHADGIEARGADGLDVVSGDERVVPAAPEAACLRRPHELLHELANLPMGRGVLELPHVPLGKQPVAEADAPQGQRRSIRGDQSTSLDPGKGVGSGCRGATELSTDCQHQNQCAQWQCRFSGCHLFLLSAFLILCRHDPRKSILSELGQDLRTPRRHRYFHKLQALDVELPDLGAACRGLSSAVPWCFPCWAAPLSLAGRPDPPRGSVGGSPRGRGPATNPRPATA